MSCITKRPEDRSYQSSVEKVSGIGIAGNLLLAGFKLVAGIVGHADDSTFEKCSARG